MRQVSYEYSPSTSLSSHHHHHQPDCAPPPPPPPAEPKPVYTPWAYKSSTCFTIFPQEWLMIVFSSSSSNRPDIIYNLAAAAAAQEFKVVTNNLAMLVQNTSSDTCICVHKATKLHQLLIMDTIESCFTLQQELAHNNDDDDDDDAP